MGGIPDGHSIKKHRHRQQGIYATCCSGAGGRGKRLEQHHGLVRLNESYLNAVSWEFADQGIGSMGRSLVSQARGAGIETVHHQKTRRPPTRVAVLQSYSPTAPHAREGCKRAAGKCFPLSREGQAGMRGASEKRRGRVAWVVGEVDRAGFVHAHLSRTRRRKAQLGQQAPQEDRLACDKGASHGIGLACRQRDRLSLLRAPGDCCIGEHQAAAAGGATCLKGCITITVSDRTKCVRPVAADKCTTHAALVGDGECARVVQVDQHALSLLEQLVRRAGQAARERTDGV
eukprot:5290195-Pleurochrysis_carterae.AAC.1